MKKVNNVYLYDGSFLNLLSIIKVLLKENIIPQNIKIQGYEENLFSSNINLEIEDDEKIIPNIIHNLGSRIFNGIYYIYLSNNDDKELLIYYFLLYSIKYKDKVFVLRKIEEVNKGLKVIKYVGNENHKMKGFLRFKELKNNVLYAEFAPTNNVLPLLVNHFKKRLKNERWLIHDQKRNIWAYYDLKEVYFWDGLDINIKIDNISDDEEKMVHLWQTFYDTIGIKERKNDRCRQNFMPKKYWKYITEVENI